MSPRGARRRACLEPVFLLNGVELVLSQFTSDGAGRWLCRWCNALVGRRRAHFAETRVFEIHADTSVSSHKSDDNVETNDTLVQVHRHKAVGDWKYDKVRRRPRRAAEWVAQSRDLAVRACGGQVQHVWESQWR